jgi:hypothetical protein
MSLLKKIINNIIIPAAHQNVFFTTDAILTFKAIIVHSQNTLRFTNAPNSFTKGNDTACKIHPNFKPALAKINPSTNSDNLCN